MSRIKRLIALALILAAACGAVCPLRAQDYQPNEVLIILRDGVSIETISMSYGTTVLDRIPDTPFYRLALPQGTTPQQALGRMYADLVINGGEPNYIVDAPEVEQSSM